MPLAVIFFYIPTDVSEVRGEVAKYVCFKRENAVGLKALQITSNYQINVCFFL